MCELHHRCSKTEDNNCCYCGEDPNKMNLRTEQTKHCNHLQLNFVQWVKKIEVQFEVQLRYLQLFQIH